MTNREMLITWVRDGFKFHEEEKEKWILGGKQGERPSPAASIANHLIANGVVMQEHGKWVWQMGAPRCSICWNMLPNYSYDNDVSTTDFCPCCGAYMRGKKR